MNSQDMNGVNNNSQDMNGMNNNPQHGMMIGASNPTEAPPENNAHFLPGPSLSTYDDQYEYQDQTDPYHQQPTTNTPSGGYNTLNNHILDTPPSEEDEDHIYDKATTTSIDVDENTTNSETDVDDQRLSELPRILLMGPRRAGKTSIQRVVFHKMSPHETLFRLEATPSVERAVVDHTPLCRFTIWDFPGDYYGPGDGGSESTGNQNRDSHVSSSDEYIFNRATALIFVIDAQDEPYDHVLQNFTETVSRAIHQNPNVAIEVFINKVDGELFLSDEAKYDCRRDIMQQVSDELHDAGGILSEIPIAYHLTSIYDHSVFEAFSRVVQKLIPSLPTLENLLNVLVSTCSMEKAYLFDVASKLYISTDSSPVDLQSVELCSDMIDVVLDVSGIYGAGAARNPMMQDNEGEISDDFEISLVGNNQAEDEDAVVDSAYDCQSSSVIHLNNGIVLYLKEVDTMLALVCLTRAENFRKKSLINYNINCLKKALRSLVLPTTTASTSLSTFSDFH